MIRIKDLPASVQHFFNTINLEGLELLEAIGKAKKQQDVVYQLFKVLPGKELTPFQVLDILIGGKIIDKKTPITSIRRAISNLSEAGLLVKTDKRAIEEYGRPNYKWKLKEPELKPLQTKLFNDTDS